MSRSFLENHSDPTPEGLSGKINASSGLKNTISAVDLSNVQVPELSLATFPGICFPQLSSDASRTACLIKLPSFNLSEFPGIDLPSVGDIDSSALASLSFPAITLADFPGLDLASFPALPGVDWTAVDLPKINLGDFPGLSLPGMPSFGTLPQLAAHALPEITVPPLDLFDFPGFQIPEGLSLEDLELLKAVKIPAIKLGDWPDIDLPSLPPIGLDGTDIDLSDFFIRLDNVAKLELPEMDLPSFPGVSLPSVSVDWSTVRLPRIKSLGVAFPDLELPGDLPNMAAFGDMFDFDLDVGMDLNLDAVSVRMPSELGMDAINVLDLKIPKLRLDMGGSLMKIKLFLGFTQCVSFFPVTFATIPWPENFLNLGNFLKLFAVDLFALFGSAACNLSTGFYDQFLFSFFLMPLIIVGASLAYMAVLAKKKSAGNKASFTAESARVRLYTMLFMIVYTLYTSVATKLFVLFKCVQIQDTWYLAADMRIVCFDATYQTYRMLSFLGIALYVVGIPAVIFMMLFRRRAWLHEEGCPKDEMYKHVQVEKSFGSVYKDYTPNNYYFDLLDLGRRLLLTGGLILVGEESNTQIFLGLLLNVMWLVLVLFRRPYKAYWDNILSIVLSFQLVMVMLCGNALELNRLTPAKKDDVYEESSFGMLMVVFTVFIVATGFVSLIISVPCLRERIVRCYAAQYTTVGEKEGGDDDGDDGGETEENTTKKKKKKKKKVKKKKTLAAKSASSNASGGSTLPRVAPVIEHEHVHHHHHHHHYHKEGEDSSSESMDSSSSEREDDDDNNNDASGVVEIRAMEVDLADL
jgi:hypothetical protein